MNKAVFMDRDGVINRKPPKGGYILRWEEMHILPGVAQAIGELNRAGFLAIVASNQRCVARGFLAVQDLEFLHRRMREKLAAAGARLDAIYYCPHDNQPVCHCRKPAPGMLLDAARAHQIDLGKSWMVGDSEIDIEAGKTAGCKTIRVLESSETTGADLVVPSLLEAVARILGTEKAPPGGQARVPG